MTPQEWVQQARSQGATNDQIDSILRSQGHSLAEVDPNTATMNAANITQNNPISPTMGQYTPLNTGTLPFITNQSQQFASGIPRLEDFIPAAGGLVGGVVGGGLGALAGGVGAPVGMVGGGAIGQAGGKALENLLQGKDIWQGVPQEAVGGAAGGLLGLGVGAIGEKILGNAAEEVATGALNLTKNQLAKIAVENGGESVSSLLGRNAAKGVDAEGLGRIIDKLQGVYDSIAKGKTPVSSDLIQNTMDNVVSTLRSSGVNSQKALADKVEQQFLDNLDKLGNNPTMDSVKALKTAFDQATPESQFGSSDWGVNRIAGDTYRTILNQSADQAGLTAADGRPLSQLGVDLMKLRNLSEVAGKRIGVGGGMDPFSLTNLVLGGGLTAAGGIPAGALGVGGRIIGKAALGNPAIAGPLSNILSSAGRVAVPVGEMTGALAGGGVGGYLGDILSPTAGNQNSTQNTNNKGAYQFQSNTPPSTTSI